MRSRTLILVIAVMAMVVAGVGPAFAQPPAPDPGPGGGAVVDPSLRSSLQAVPGGVRILVTLTTPGLTTSSLENRRATVGAAQDRVLSALAGAVGVRTRFATIPALVLDLPSVAALDRLAALPGVARIDRDAGAGTGDLDHTVPIIGADTLHAAGITGAGVTVAVLDTGADTDHPDLAGAIGQQACFGSTGTTAGAGFCANGTDRQTGAGAAEDNAGHGTHVTGIVTSDGNVSSVGVAPGADIVAVKVMDNCSLSGCFYAFSEIVAAMDYIANHPEFGVDVLNMSLGTGTLYTGECDNVSSFTAAGKAVVDALRANGVTVFASAGNSGSGTSMPAPACLSNVVSVGATDTVDAVPDFSNSNSNTDVFAPGVGVVSDAIGGGTRSLSGTSMASPTSAACAALIRQARPAESPATIETTLEATGVPVTDSTNGLTFPRINCAAAVGPVGPVGPTLGVSDSTTAEGNSGTHPSAFTVTLSAPATQAVTVHYATANGTATAPGDYAARVDTVLTFQPGQTSKTVNVTVKGDTLAEPTETFTLNLTTPVGATIADGTGVGTITTDDAATPPGISVSDSTSAEGSSGTHATAFTVTLSAPSTQAVTVHYATANGTATAPTDYAARADTLLTFAAGQTSRTVNVTVKGDTLVEPDETFTLNLTTPVGATITDGTGVGTITTDDAATLGVSDSTTTEGNAGTHAAAFIVTLSAPSTQPVTVHYASTNGTAVAPGDYAARLDTVLTFAPGQTSRTVNVTVKGDTLVEPTETFTLNLTTSTGATIVDGTGVGTITNDD